MWRQVVLRRQNAPFMPSVAPRVSTGRSVKFNSRIAPSQHASRTLLRSYFTKSSTLLDETGRNAPLIVSNRTFSAAEKPTSTGSETTSYKDIQDVPGIAQRLLSYNSVQEALDDGYDRKKLLQHVDAVVRLHTTSYVKGMRQSPIVLEGEPMPKSEDILGRQLGRIVRTLILPEHDMLVDVDDINLVLKVVMFTLRGFAHDASHPSTRVTLDDGYDAQDLLHNACSIRPVDSTGKPVEHLQDSERIQKTLLLSLNHTLQLWSAFAGGANVETQRIAAQNAEHLLMQAGQQWLHHKRTTNGETLNPSSPDKSALSSAVVPTAISFNIVIGAWSKCAKRSSSDDDNFGTSAAERAQALLHLLIELSQEGNGKMLEPSSVSYDSALKAWVSSGDRHALDHGMAILHDMVDNYEKRGYDTKPSVMTLTTMYHLLANSMLPNIEPHVQELAHVTKSMEIQPTTILYNSLLTAYYRCKPLSAEDEYRICETMNDIVHDMEASNTAQPDQLTYQTALQAWVDCGHRFSKAKTLNMPQKRRALEKCAQHAERHLEAAVLSTGIDVHMVQHVMAAYALYDPLHVERIFSSYFGNYEKTSRSTVRPTVQSYGVLLEALRKGSRSNRKLAQSANNHLSEMERLSKQSGFKHLCPDSGCYNSVILAWAATQTAYGAMRADQVLDRLCKSYHTQLESLQRDPMYRMRSRPSITSFMSVITALSRHCQSDGRTGDRLEDLVHQMESMERAKANESNPKIARRMAQIEPPEVAYNVLLNFYAHQARDGKGLDMKAEEVISRMKAKDERVHPDQYSYSALMKIYDLSGTPTSKILEVFDSLCSGKEKDVLDLHFFNIVLNTLGRRRRECGALEKARELLFGMESGVYGPKCRPDLVSYTSLATAYKNLGTLEAARQAEELLNRCYDSESDNFERKDHRFSDSSLFNCVIAAYADSDTQEGITKIDSLLQCMETGRRNGVSIPAPSAWTYNAVMRLSSPERAQELFDRMMIRYRGGDENSKPSSLSFVTLLRAWMNSSSPESAERAEEALRMKDAFHSEDLAVFADELDYLQVMQKWGESLAENGAERAESLLDEMVSAYDLGANVTAPSADLYRRVLLNYMDRGNPSDPAKAQGVLERMIDRAEQKDGPKPSTKFFSICMNAWANSRQIDGDRNAELLLDRSIELSKLHAFKDVKPDSSSYDAVLKACAHVPSDDKKKSSETLERGMRLFSVLKNGNDLQLSPDSYGYMFRVINMHMGHDHPNRSKLLQELFKDCCKEGKLSLYSFAEFRKSVSEVELCNVLRVDKQKTIRQKSVYDLPAKWRRNVRKKK